MIECGSENSDLGGNLTTKNEELLRDDDRQVRDYSKDVVNAKVLSSVYS